MTLDGALTLLTSTGRRQMFMCKQTFRLGRKFVAARGTACYPAEVQLGWSRGWGRSWQTWMEPQPADLQVMTGIVRDIGNLINRQKVISRLGAEPNVVDAQQVCSGYL